MYDKFGVVQVCILFSELHVHKIFSEHVEKKYVGIQPLDGCDVHSRTRETGRRWGKIAHLSVIIRVTANRAVKRISVYNSLFWLYFCRDSTEDGEIDKDKTASGFE